MMKNIKYIVFQLTLVLLYTNIHAQSYIINLYAGDYIAGFSGDGGKATAAQINANEHIAMDKAGNLYIADANNNRIRMVKRGTGIITTIAGTGKTGTKGDGGYADSAQITQPSGIAVDDSGNIYIGSRIYSSVRKITKATGLINTIAGKLNATKRGDGGPAINANLNEVHSLCLDDSANLYILTSQGVRKVYKKTGIITTVAGGDTSGRPGSSADGYHADTCLLSLSYGITVDHAGNIYIAETDNHKVRKVTKSTGLLSTVAGTGTAGYSGDGGVATLAELNKPEDVAFDKKGNLLICDANNARLRQVNFKTNGVISTISGNGTCSIFSVSGDGGLADSATCGAGSICVDTFGYIFINIGTGIRILKATTGSVELTKEQLQNKLNLYPNPATAAFTVNYTVPLSTQNARLSITNILGEEVRTYNVPVYDNKYEIDNVSLPEGMYVARLYADGMIINSTKMLIVR